MMEAAAADTVDNNVHINGSQRDTKEIQKWIDSLLTSHDVGSEQAKEGESTIVLQKKSVHNDDLILGDEATSTTFGDPDSQSANRNSLKVNCDTNLFQNMMRKKFAENVTGGSFNSDTTNDSFYQILDSRRKSAEVILRNLGFSGCRSEEADCQSVPGRFFQKPSAASGINTGLVAPKVPDTPMPPIHDLVSTAVISLLQFINNEKGQNMSEDRESGGDEIDGEEEKKTMGGVGNAFEQSAIVEAIKEIFMSKASPNGPGACSTSTSGTPVAKMHSSKQMIRPQLKTTSSGTRYWTILQPDNNEYLDSIGYYDTLPSVAEPFQQPNHDLEEQFSATLAKLQQLERPIRKKRKRANLAGYDDDDAVKNSSYRHHSNENDYQNSSKRPSNPDLVAHGEIEKSGSEVNDGGDLSPSKKIMNLPSRFLKAPTLLGSLSQFIPESCVNKDQGHGRHSTDITDQLGYNRSPSLHRQTSFFADTGGFVTARLSDDSSSNNNNNNSVNTSYDDDVPYRLSESSYSCGESSCSSLPRDLDLERYYASKNLLRIPTAESDEACSCVSDRTATNEQEGAGARGRGPSVSEEADRLVGDDGAFPDLTDFKRKMRVRMIRQTSSHSDSSGFGESEFVDAVTHQSSRASSTFRLNELSRSHTIDGLSSLSEHGNDKNLTGSLSSSSKKLCMSCFKTSQDVLKIESWSQTVLSFLKEGDEERKEKEDKCFRSEVTIPDTGDKSISYAPLNSEVCLFRRDPMPAQQSTTLSIQVSNVCALESPRRRYREVKGLESNNDDDDDASDSTTTKGPLVKYELLSTDSLSYQPQLLRRQQQLPCRPQLRLPLQDSFCHPLPHYLPPPSLFLQSCLGEHHNCKDKSHGHDNHNSQAVRQWQVTQLMRSMEDYRSEIKQLQMQSVEMLQSDDPANLGTNPEPHLLLYTEVLKQVEEIDQLLMTWFAKSLKTNGGSDGGDNSNDDKLNDIKRQADTLEIIMAMMRNQSHYYSHHRPITSPSLSVGGANYASPKPPYSNPPMALMTQPTRGRPPALQEISSNHIADNISLMLPIYSSSMQFSTTTTVPAKATTTTTTPTDLESVKDRLNHIEEKLRFQQEQQETSLRAIFGEFKDTLLRELTEATSKHS